VSVCLSVTFVSPAKTAKSIEMQFAGLTSVQQFTWQLKTNILPYSFMIYQFNIRRL